MKTARSSLLSAAACLSLLAAASPALGQAAGDVRPPVPGSTAEAPTIRTWLFVGLLSAACIGAVLIPSKRGHQD